MRVVAMIQARCGSRRLPNKVLMDLCGRTVLERVIERVQRSIYVDEVIVITSIDKANLPILRLCADMGIRVGIGAEEDVLDRYYQTARLLKPDYILRITADCPCIDHGLIDRAILQITDDIDYCSSVISNRLADGLDIELIKYNALKRAWKEANHSYEREHVTQYIIHHPDIFKIKDFYIEEEYFGNHRWTVDEAEDYELVKKIYEHFFYEESKEDFNYRDVLDFLNRHHDIKAINQKYRRNEGLQKSIDKDVLVVLES